MRTPPVLSESSCRSCCVTGERLREGEFGEKRQREIRLGSWTAGGTRESSAAHAGEQVAVISFMLIK
jgi:hypothetical protein